MKTNFFRKKFIPYYIMGLLALVLMLSLIWFFCSSHGKRRTFVFPSADGGKNVVETRYLPKNPNKTAVHYYVDEILLGSSIERTMMLFAPGTKALSCIENDKCLYINLSSDVIASGDDVISIRDGIKLLKENISHNFKKFKTIEVFVDGKHAF